ncbi:uncharacterized protein [Penaeus vannamei]|uniref:uncharacterized protein n=1 Tax=Penaeus vannamei TaxID=6689 RepID=UPI00387F6DFA
MLRSRKKIKPEIADEQCGFVEGEGTSNAAYILKTLSERAIEVQQGLSLCFIDYTKAFDKGKNETIMKSLEDTDLDGKDLRIIHVLETNRPLDDMILRKIEGKPGVKVGGRNINNLRYADGTILIAGNEEDLQSLVNIINEESENMGQGRKIQTIGNILTSRKISLNVRKRVRNTHVYPILTYSSETWNVNKHQKRLEATEMWLLRRMLYISYKDHVKNEDVQRKTETSRSLVNYIRRRQATFFGHIMRKLGMEHTATA